MWQPTDTHQPGELLFPGATHRPELFNKEFRRIFFLFGSGNFYSQVNPKYPDKNRTRTTGRAHATVLVVSTSASLTLTCILIADG